MPQWSFLPPSFLSEEMVFSEKRMVFFLGGRSKHHALYICALSEHHQHHPYYKTTAQYSVLSLPLALCSQMLCILYIG